MLEDSVRPVQFRDIWFNGYHHLRGETIEAFGAVQGERLTSAILRNHLPWNRAFGGKSIECRGIRPVAKTLAGGLKLTLLSPNRKKLESLVPVWEKSCREAGLIPGVKARRAEAARGLESFGHIDIDKLAALPFQEDHSEPNGTSIALLAEYRNKRLLLAADAHPDLLEESLSLLARHGPGKLRLDAMKISHHASSHNTSPKLLSLISCPRFLVSTNGSIYHHPDQVAMARLICLGGAEKEIIFNYRTDETALWDNPKWKRKYGYHTHYPHMRKDGNVVVSL